MPEEIIETAELGDKIVAVLKTIFDPEIPVDIYELGLIYDVKISSKNEVKVIMTLTSPSCPVAESMPEEIREAVKKIKTVSSVDVEVTFDPPWEKSMMSEEAKLELGLL